MKLPANPAGLLGRGPRSTSLSNSAKSPVERRSREKMGLCPTRRWGFALWGQSFPEEPLVEGEGGLHPSAALP